jgi:hypothetical protein
MIRRMERSSSVPSERGCNKGFNTRSLINLLFERIGNHEYIVLKNRIAVSLMLAVSPRRS